MVMVRTIQVRLKRDQYERIQQNAERKGFISLSSYIRHVALDQDFLLHQKIHEIHKHLVGEAEKSPQPKNRKVYRTPNMASASLH